MSDLHTEIVNTTRALIIVLDTDGRIVMFNPACERLTGYPFEEVQGRRVWEFLLAPEEADGVMAVFADLRAGHSPNTHENHWIAKSGERCCIEWSNSAVTDESGRVTYIIGTGIDVTEKRAADRAQRASEAHFRDLAENLPLVFWVREMPSGRISYISGAYEKIWGRRLGDLEEAYQSFVRSIHPDDRETLFRQMQRETGLNEPTETEYRIIRADGAVRWIHSRAISLQDETGQVRRIVGFAHDITERKRAQEAQREAEANYRMLFESSLDAILVTTPDGRILAANPEACRIFGRTAVELRDLGWAAVVDATDPRLPAAREERARTGRSKGELTLVHRDGTKFPVEVSTAAVKDINGEDHTYARTTFSPTLSRRWQRPSAFRRRRIQELSGEKRGFPDSTGLDVRGYGGRKTMTAKVLFDSTVIREAHEALQQAVWRVPTPAQRRGVSRHRRRARHRAPDRDAARRAGMGGRQSERRRDVLFCAPQRR